jgi:hypothetical protein
MVVLIHGFPSPGLASSHRGWGIHTHSIFTRRPQGEPAAFSICRTAIHRPPSGGLLSGHLRDRHDYPPYGKNSGNDSRPSGLDPSAHGGAERAEHPTRNQPPSVGGSVGHRRQPAPGTADEAKGWSQGDYGRQNQGHCCSKSSVSFRFLERREILLTVRGDTSFCSTRGA